MEEVIDKIEANCEVCNVEIKQFKDWKKHCKTKNHQENVLKFTMKQLGVNTIEEFPDALDLYLKNYVKKTAYLDNLNNTQSLEELR